MSKFKLLFGFCRGALHKHQQVTPPQTLRQFWYLVRPMGITMYSEAKNTYIGGHSMFFFLIVLMQVMEQFQPTAELKAVPMDPGSEKEINKENVKVGYYRMDDFVKLAELIPDEVLPPYRNKRSYINSVLSAHEISRQEHPSCKQVFLRVGHGIYVLHPDNQWVQQGKDWQAGRKEGIEGDTC